MQANQKKWNGMYGTKVYRDQLTDVQDFLRRMYKSTTLAELYTTCRALKEFLYHNDKGKFYEYFKKQWMTVRFGVEAKPTF
jgi:hypothetical protein